MNANDEKSRRAKISQTGMLRLKAISREQGEAAAKAKGCAQPEQFIRYDFEECDCEAERDRYVRQMIRDHAEPVPDMGLFVVTNNVRMMKDARVGDAFEITLKRTPRGKDDQ